MKPLPLTDIFRIGVVGKPHGVSGETLVYFDEEPYNDPDRESLVLIVDGIPVPFFIRGYRVRSAQAAIVSFFGVDSQRQAASLTHAEVCLERGECDEADEEALTLTALRGYTVAACGEGGGATDVGVIAGVDMSTANCLFELADGRLIPAAPELIEDIDPDSRRVLMRLPEGLCEL